MTLARLFLFFGSLLVLALFAALIGPLFIDWTNYREDFEREASRILGREVIVHGTADARLLPFPSVTFNQIEVGPRPGEPPMMEIDRFTMDAELAPFLSGEIHIFDMRIERPDVHLVLDENGAIDWGGRPGSDIPGGSVVLERVEIVNGSLSVEDRQNGRTHEFMNVQSILSADALTGPWRVQGTADMGGGGGAFSVSTGQLQEDGTLRINTRIVPDAHPISLELQGSAAIEDGRPRYDGNFTLQVLDIAGSQSTTETATPAASQPALRGTGLFEATSQRLRVSEYRLEMGGGDDPYVVQGEATLDTGEQPEFLLVANGQQVDIDRLGRNEPPGASTESKTERHPEPLSATERLAAFRRLVERVPVPDLPGRISLSLPALIAGDTTFRDLRLEARPAGDGWQVATFGAALPGRTRLEASGRLSLGDDFGFTGEMLLASNQPSGFAAWLSDDVPSAIRELSDAGFEAKVTLTENAQHFEDLELIVDRDRLTGTFRHLRSGEDAGVTLELAGDRFDLDVLGALVSLFSGDAASGLARRNVDAHLVVDQFAAYGLTLGGVETAFTLENGLLDLDELTIEDLAGARVSGQGTFSELTGSPQGSGIFSVEAEEMAGLLNLARQRLGGTFPLSVMQTDPSAYQNTSIDIRLDLGSARQTDDASANGFTAAISGETGGSTVNAMLSGAGSIMNPFADTFSLDLTADNPEGRTLLAQIGLPVLPFETGDALSLSLDTSKAPGEDVRLAVELSSPANGNVTLEGGLNARNGRVETAAFDMALDASNIEPYLLLGGLGLPGFGIGLPVEVSASISATSDNWEIAGLEGTIGGNAMAADLTLPRSGDAITTGNVELDTLDLAWLGELFYGQPLLDAESDGWSDTGFATSAPPLFPADLTVRAASADLGHREPARHFVTDLSYRPGTLRLFNASADWLGGRIGGEIAFGSVEEAGTVSLRAELVGARVARLLAPAGDQSPASGVADLSISLEGAGKSARAVVGAMTGSGALQLSGLDVEGFEDDALPAILAAADQEGFEITAENVSEVAREAIIGGSFHADSISVPLTVAGGTVRASNVVIDSPAAGLRGGLSLDLADAGLQAGFEMSFDAGDESLPGADPILGLTIAGPLMDPDLTIDATRLSNFLSMRAYERERRRVERVQATVLTRQRLRREAELVRERMDERRQVRLDQEDAQRLLDNAARDAVERARREREIESTPPFDASDGALEGTNETQTQDQSAPDEAPEPMQPAAPEQQTTPQTPDLDFRSLQLPAPQTPAVPPLLPAPAPQGDLPGVDMQGIDPL